MPEWISPPLSGRTPLASLGGWDLLLHCRRCGVKQKPVSEVAAKVHPSTELERVLPRLACLCGGKPERIEAIFTPSRRAPADRPTVDLTFIMEAERKDVA